MFYYYFIFIFLGSAGSSLNVHAPIFASKINNHNLNINLYPTESASYNGGNQILQNSVPVVNYSHDLPSLNSRTVLQASQNYTNGPVSQNSFDTYNTPMTYCEPLKTVNGDVQSKAHPKKVYAPTTNFKLNPTVSCFVPSNFQNQIAASNTSHTPIVEPDTNVSQNTEKEETFVDEETDSLETEVSDLQIKPNGIELKEETKVSEANVSSVSVKSEQTSVVTPSAPRSWADIVSRGQSANKNQVAANKPAVQNGSKVVKVPIKLQEPETLSLDEDKLALVLGSKLHF